MENGNVSVWSSALKLGSFLLGVFSFGTPMWMLVVYPRINSVQAASPGVTVFLVLLEACASTAGGFAALKANSYLKTSDATLAKPGLICIGILGYLIWLVLVF